MKKMRKSNLIILAGLLCLCYPFAAILFNNAQTAARIEQQQSEAGSFGQQKIEQELSLADAYNETYKDRNPLLKLSDEEYQEYLQTLNPYGDGVMGVIEIPSIELKLNIAHTTEPDVLETQIGHYETSALPVGGMGTRAALFGHRGLPTQSLFTRLNELKDNDLILITVLNRKMAYRVIDTFVTDPEDHSYMVPDKDKDELVLVTCTPFGINNKRLIVLAERSELPPAQETKTGIPMEVWVLVSLTIMAAGVWILYRIKKKTDSKNLSHPQ